MLVEGVDIPFGSFLFSHHGEWQAVEVQDKFVGNLLFVQIWLGIYLIREYFEILKMS